MQLSAVIPAYNEEGGIAGAVAQLDDALDELGLRHEILVVDNASQDGTVAALEELRARRPLEVLVNDANRGKGYSVRRGMLAARGDLRLHCDADCAGSAESLPRMLELIESADVVVGSRLAEGAAVGRRQPLGRRVVGRTFVDLCRLVLREPTRDLYCGFKLWRAEAAVAAYSRTRLDGWVFDAEALAMARALGYRLVETGIAWQDREGSRLSMPRVLAPALRELLAARRQVRRASAVHARDGEMLVPEPVDRVP